MSDDEDWGADFDLAMPTLGTAVISGLAPNPENAETWDDDFDFESESDSDTEGKEPECELYLTHRQSQPSQIGPIKEAI